MISKRKDSLLESLDELSAQVLEIAEAHENLEQIYKLQKYFLELLKEKGLPDDPGITSLTLFLELQQAYFECELGLIASAVKHARQVLGHELD